MLYCTLAASCVKTYPLHLSTLAKTLKRTMAGEYSRELSKKDFAGQARLIELGFRQGGAPGFGLRRMLVDENGVQKGLLDRGEHKSIQTDRVILVPGPPEEVAIVRQIFELFVSGRKSKAEICEILNNQGVLTDLGRSWSTGVVRQILTNEKYIGNKSGTGNLSSSNKTMSEICQNTGCVRPVSLMPLSPSSSLKPPPRWVCRSLSITSRLVQSSI